MTDSGGSSPPEWASVLAELSRIAGHELRNALNAVVVNLEVVRSRTTDEETSRFVGQAVEQSEEAVRLAQAATALVGLVVGAIDERGAVRCVLSAPGAVALASSPDDAGKAVQALRPLASRDAIGVDSSDATIILSIPAPTA